jgi:hypothetical protein
MRSVAAAGFVALGFGCNAILGLDPTKLEPDGLPPRPPGVVVTQQSLTAIQDVIAESPLVGLDSVKFAPMGMAFSDLSCADNPPPCTQAFDSRMSQFPLPEALVSQSYRLLYQPVGDPIPHEVQWSFTTPHLVVPFFGKPGQPPAPMNATVNITAVNHPGAFDTPLVFSFGTNWSAGGFTQANPNNPANYDFTANATPVDGSLATLQNGTDAEMMVDFTAGIATGGARFNVDLVANTIVPVVTDPWDTTMQSIQFTAPSNINFFDRLETAYGNIVGNLVPSPMIYAGVLPSAKLPPLAIRPFQPVLDPLAIPMFALAKAPANASSMTFANPFTGMNKFLQPAIAWQVTQSRTDGALTLYHSFQWIRLASQLGSSVAVDAGQIGIPINPKLGTTVLRQSDNLTVSLAGASTLTLTFGLDQTTQDCIATLYQVNGASLNAIRSYQVIAPATSTVAIQIDASMFQIGPKYVFGIVCRSGGDQATDPGVGFPAARTAGDYSQVGYPFSISTVFPSTFSVTP